MFKMEKLTAFTGILLLCLCILAYSQYTSTKEYKGSVVAAAFATTTVKENPLIQLNKTIKKAFAPIDLNNNNTTNELLTNVITKIDLEKNLDAVNNTVKELIQDTALTCVDPVDAEAIQSSMVIINSQLKKFNISYFTKDGNKKLSDIQIQSLKLKLEELQPTLQEKFAELNTEIAELLIKLNTNCKSETRTTKETSS